MLPMSIQLSSRFLQLWLIFLTPCSSVQICGDFCTSVHIELYYFSFHHHIVHEVSLLVTDYPETPNLSQDKTSYTALDVVHLQK